MDGKTIAAYVGAGISIAFGVALLWFPPTNIAGQPGTVGAAFAFVTGGLAAFGITVTIPPILNMVRRAPTTRRLGGTPMPQPPVLGHGYLVFKINTGINDPDVDTALSKIPAEASPPDTTVTHASRMADPGNPASPGDRVVVTVETDHPGRSIVAHDRIVALGQKIALLTNGAGNVVWGLENHWCCYSDL